MVADQNLPLDAAAAHACTCLNLCPLERRGWIRAEPGLDRRERYFS
jgi:hypothetical protein